MKANIHNIEMGTFYFLKGIFTFKYKEFNLEWTFDTIVHDYDFSELIFCSYNHQYYDLCFTQDRMSSVFMDIQIIEILS